MFKCSLGFLFGLFAPVVLSASLPDTVREIEAEVEVELRNHYKSAYISHNTTVRVPRTLSSVECNDYRFNKPEGGVLGRASWSVTCEGDLGVRSRIITNTELEIYVPVLQRSVSRGDLIHTDDWVSEPLFVSRDMGYAMDVSVEYFANRNLRAGQAVRMPHLVPVRVINEGDITTLKIDRPGVVVEVEVVALSSADIGQSLQVRSSSSGKLMDAIVVSEGYVVHSH